MSQNGSDWSRWDLHIHTPASYEHHYGDRDWDRFLDDLERLPPEITVIGINDYLTVDGYERILEAREAGRLPKLQMVLPVIELRIKRFAGQEDWQRINYHVIFSDEVPIEAIRSEFLSSITSTYQLEDGKPPWSGPPLENRLKELGKAIKAAAPPGSSFKSDLETGITNFNIEPDKLKEALTSSAFHGKYITTIGNAEWRQMRWTTGGIAEKRNIINSVDFVFTACETEADFDADREALDANTVNGRLLHCSDAHHFSDSDQLNRIGHCMTWIKSEPCFDGLLLARHEYQERVWVGDEPEQRRRARENPTRYLQSVTLGGTKRRGSWFDGVEMPLNPGLVAIIGNKGSGKSALADGIALVADARVEEYFSFLHRRRFRDPLSGKADDHRCDVKWLTGLIQSKKLHESVDYSNPERVRYLPQNYFEQLCSEVGDRADSEFEAQLKEVVFSRLPEDERLGTTSLDDLVDLRANEWRERHRLQVGQLAEIVDRIVRREAALLPSSIRDAEKRLRARQEDLKAHEAIKPADEPEPAVPKAEPDPAMGEIEAIRLQIADLDEQTQAVIAQLGVLRQRRQALSNVNDKLRNVETYFDSQLRTGDVTTALATEGIDLDSIVTVRIDQAPLTAATALLDLGIADQRAEQDRIATTRAALDAERTTLVARLDEAARAKRERIEERERWQTQRAAIIGNKEAAGSVSYLQAVLDSLPYAIALLEQDLQERAELFSVMFTDLIQLQESYRQLFAPVSAYLEGEELLRGGFDMQVDALIQEEGISSKLLNMIDRSKAGPYFQVPDNFLDSTLDATDFGDVASVRKFINGIVGNLVPYRDARPTKGLEAQLRQGYKPADIYNLLYGLDYLVPHYALKFNHKEIAQLSPGERGAALLVFYLLVDRSDIPILLDQPEENLDNETVSRLLVPAVRAARKRRQVIVVTHNPNLAVYCDADQIIHATLERTPSTRISYRSGAIEDIETRKWLVNVLEGTGRAFTNRYDKYGIGPQAELVLRGD